MKALDVKTLIGEVAARHGVTLKPDDPALALVTLNQLVLEGVVMGLSEQTRQMAREFEENLGCLQAQLGSILGSEVRNALTGLRHNVTGSDTKGSVGVADRQHCALAALPIRWLAAGMVTALALFLLGVVVGKLWR